MTWKKAFVSGLIGLVIGGGFSFLANYFLVPVPADVLGNSIGNGVSGAFAGFFGAFGTMLPLVLASKKEGKASQEK